MICFLPKREGALRYRNRCAPNDTEVMSDERKDKETKGCCEVYVTFVTSNFGPPFFFFFCLVAEHIPAPALRVVCFHDPFWCLILYKPRNLIESE